MTDGYWYLCSPYSKFPAGHEAAFNLACENAALLLSNRISIFCPIAHSHPLVAHGLKAVDHDFWINVVDRPMMEGAKGLIFLEAESWAQSSGMHEEIVEFVKAGKPVVFMRPGEVPEELLPLTLESTSIFETTKYPPRYIVEPDPVMTAYAALLKATKNDHNAVVEFNILVDDGIEPCLASRVAAEDWAKRQPQS